MRDVVQKFYLSVIYFLPFFFRVMCYWYASTILELKKSGDSHSSFSRLYLVILYRRQYRIVIKWTIVTKTKPIMLILNLSPLIDLLWYLSFVTSVRSLGFHVIFTGSNKFRGQSRKKPWNGLKSAWRVQTTVQAAFFLCSRQLGLRTGLIFPLQQMENGITQVFVLQIESNFLEGTSKWPVGQELSHRCYEKAVLLSFLIFIFVFQLRAKPS